MACLYLSAYDFGLDLHRFDTHQRGPHSAADTDSTTPATTTTVVTSTQPAAVPVYSDSDHRDGGGSSDEDDEFEPRSGSYSAPSSAGATAGFAVEWPEHTIEDVSDGGL